MSKAIVTFTKNWRAYAAGEIAGFDQRTADALIEGSYATEHPERSEAGGKPSKPPAPKAPAAKSAKQPKPPTGNKPPVDPDITPPEPAAPAFEDDDLPPASDAPAVDPEEEKP